MSLSASMKDEKLKAQRGGGTGEGPDNVLHSWDAILNLSASLWHSDMFSKGCVSTYKWGR